jgi:hypothetical protein
MPTHMDRPSETMMCIRFDPNMDGFAKFALNAAILEDQIPILLNQYVLICGGRAFLHIPFAFDSTTLSLY